jgi:hypothetical protein
MKMLNLLFLMLFPSITMATEKGFFCSNCSYEEAVEIAMREAAPTVHCVIHQMSSDEQVEQCSSLPKRFFVVNERSKQIFPLVVFHKHQKSQRQQLSLATRNGALRTEQQLSILKALAAKRLFFPLLLEMSDKLSGEASSNLRTDSGIQHADTSCYTDPHTQALEHAMSESHRMNLQLRARANYQQTLNKPAYSALKDIFKLWTFTSLGMHGGADQGGFDIRWEDNVRAYNFAETYTSTGGSFSQLRWGIYLTASDDLEVKLSPTTSVIGGFGLDALLGWPTGALPPKISSCLIDVLQNSYFARTIYERANEKQSQHFEQTTDMIGRNESRDVGLNCKYSFFDRDDNLMMQFLSKCPL